MRSVASVVGVGQLLSIAGPVTTLVGPWLAERDAMRLNLELRIRAVFEAVIS